MSEQDNKEPAQPLDIYQLIMVFMDRMAEVSWQKLGLQPDMLTGKIEPSYPDARVAIDLTAHMAGLVEPKLDDADRRRVQTLVRDLRMNYVQKTKEGGE